MTIDRRPLLAFVLASLLLTISCGREYSFEQEKVELQSLGHELFVVWRKDAARSAENSEARVQMLDDNYVEFVDAVDTIAPEDQLPQIDRFLANLLTLVDDGIVPALTRKLAVVLREAAENLELLVALARPAGPPAESYVSPQTAPNILGYITGFARLVDLVAFQSRIVLENDGIDEDGNRTFEESGAISDMLRVLSRTLARSETGPDHEPLAAMVRDMAMQEDERFTPRHAVDPVWVVLFDDRGYPQTARDADGNVTYPFVDQDGDQLADVDAQGRFVLQNGEAMLLRPFALQSQVEEPVGRDAVGRATVPGGFAFEYVDLNKTALGFLVREFHGLSQQDTMYDMLTAFKTIMGQKRALTDEIGGYEGYAPDQPLMDMSYAAIHAMDSPRLPGVLQGVSELTERKTDQLAKLMWALDNTKEILDRDPSAGMSEEQTLVYDLLPILEEITADPELFADVMAAFRQPITRKTGEALSTMLRYRDSGRTPVPNGPYDACFQSCQASYTIGTLSRYDCIRACPNDEIFELPTDYAAAESEESRSNFQKFLHLLRDTSGQPYSMDLEQASYDGRSLPQVPPLIVLPGAAEAMVAAIAGNLDLADYVPAEVWTSDFGEVLNYLGVDSGDVATLMSTLSELFGTHLDRNPRPDQITRLFNQKDLRYESDKLLLDIADPVCKDGYRVADHLAYLLFTAEAAGVIDTIYPLAKAFSDHGREDLMTQMMVVFHEHYSSREDLYRTQAGGPSPMKGANLRSYEKALDEIMSSGELFDALYELSVAIDEVEQETGLTMTEDLRQVLHKALVRDGFTNRRGEAHIVVNDGRTISNPSRMHFMLHALDEASKRLDDAPETRERLGAAVGNLVDLLVGAEKDSGGVPRFKHPGSVALTVHTTRYLARRAAEKWESGQLSIWLTEDVLRAVEEFWSSRMLGGMVDLASNTLEDEHDQQLLDDFVTHLLGNPEGQKQVLVATHQLLVRSVARERWLPIAKFLGATIDPDRSWNTEPYADVPLVTLLAQLLAASLEVDPDNTGLFLVHRGLAREPYQRAPFDVIIDMIARYFSTDPSAEIFQSEADYEHFLSKMGEYLSDDVHGMERLYELVDRRLR